MTHLALALSILAPAQPALIAPGAPMHFTIGNDVALQVQPREQAEAEVQRIAKGAAAAGVTAFEPYVKWMLLEPEEGKWDFSFYDMQVAEYGRHGIKWVPFLIAGPAYATPKWFKDGPESVFAKCLEHGQETRTQSIWNPHLPARVDRLVKAFADHYDHRQIQALLLGISGDFGETIYTVSGNHWTYIWDGEYHHHLGWWCGDDHAVADFRRAMGERYHTVAALNAAWGTQLASLDEVRPFIPDAKHSRRARLDLVGWYRGSMTRYAELWLETCRRHLPDVQVLLCTGGDGNPAIGADFSEQAVVAARHGAGIRITNEASDYATNFVITRWVGSACRNLGAYFGYEPAGEVNLRAIAARIYNATCSGADELFVYDNPPAGERGERYAKYRRLLVKRQPEVPVAVFLPKTSQALGLWGDFYAQAAAFRDYTDFDFLDETLIDQGFLSRYKALVWLTGPVTERGTLERIEAWAKQGGRLFSRVRPETVEGEAWRDRLDAVGATRVEGGDLAGFGARVAGAAPELVPDGKADRLYVTRFRDGSALALNYGEAPQTFRGVTIAPGEIGP